MSNKNSEYFLRIDKSLVDKLKGDPAAMLWYGALRDYARRFKPDDNGFVRLSTSVAEQDFGITPRQVRYLSHKLQTAGLIVLDNTPRGGRTPMGFKIF